MKGKEYPLEYRKKVRLLIKTEELDLCEKCEKELFEYVIEVSLSDLSHELLSNVRCPSCGSNIFVSFGRGETPRTKKYYYFGCMECLRGYEGHGKWRMTLPELFQRIIDGEKKKRQGLREQRNENIRHFVEGRN